MKELVTLNKIEQSKLAIRQVKSLDEIKKVVDQSEALKAYAKSAQMSAEIQSDIAELSMRATRRLGEISAALKKCKGKRTDLVRVTDEVNKTKTVTLYSVGISRQKANAAERIAAIPEKEFEQKIFAAKSNAERITHSLFKTEEAENKIAKDSKAFIRVDEYRRSGIKPEGWIDGADDRLAKEADARDARLEAYWKEMAEKKGREEKYINDPFLDKFRAYLNGLENDARRVVVCNGIMKICRQVLAGLQKK